MSSWPALVPAIHGSFRAEAIPQALSLVTPGEAVKEGTVLGRTGSTGRSTGPHLHYEVRVDGRPIDPMRYFDAGSKLDALL